MKYNYQILFVALLSLVILLPQSSVVDAQSTTGGFIATTTLTTAICGNGLVEPTEQCDVPGETGLYSTTIAGRQCTKTCQWGPYCGDGILQTTNSEQCDDGNNASGDFCSPDCKIVPSGSGGGGSAGGGGAPSGGSNTPLGDTQVNIVGQTAPSVTVNISLDGKSVGTVQSDASGVFNFATNAPPGTVSMGFWILDSKSVRSITYNTTFDVTQGAITNVTGILIPPTIQVDKVNANPGDTVTFSGFAVPGSIVTIYSDGKNSIGQATSTATGQWQIALNTKGMSAAKYAITARYTVGAGIATTQSTFSTSLQIFLGVNGKPTASSDLNQDGSVNLTDFSILIFWWGTAGGNSTPPADINGDGTVGLADFSIMLYNWTG